MRARLVMGKKKMDNIKNQKTQESSLNYIQYGIHNAPKFLQKILKKEFKKHLKENVEDMRKSKSNFNPTYKN